MTDFERPSTDPTSPDPTGTPTTPTDATDTDTTAAPVPTQPIAAPPGGTPTPKPNRARWFAAAGLIALVVAATALITLSLTASTSNSVVLGYVPADSTMYGEVRLDLPGDQRQKLGQFLSKFPGFADQAALESKLDEVLDRLASESTKGTESYTTDIKPWFDGQIGFSVGPMPESPASDPSAAAKSVRALLLVAVKDQTLASSWFSKVFSEAHITGTKETYQGTELTLFSDPMAGDLQMGYGIVGGKVALVGDAASVKAAVDTKGASGIAKAAGFAAADAALKGDDVGFVFVNMRALMEASMRLSKTMASAPPVSDALLAMVPDWTAMRLRFEGDAVLLDTALPHVDAAMPASGNRPNAVAGFAPATTVALASGNDFGSSLQKLIKIYRDDPTTADAFKQIDQAAGLIGGLDNAVGWMGDTGLVVSTTADGVEGGVVSVPADAAAAQQLLTQLRSMLQLAGGQAGVSVRDETYDGQTITIVDLGSLKDLAGMAGAFGGVPADPNTVPDGHAQLAYIANDQVVAIGTSADFVKHVLDAGAGASLADDARFKGLLGRVSPNHTGVNFADIAAIRGLIERAMARASAQERTEYEESVKPFLVPFDAYIASGVAGDSVDQGHAVITVK